MKLKLLQINQNVCKKMPQCSKKDDFYCKCSVFETYDKQIIRKYTGVSLNMDIIKKVVNISFLMKNNSNEITQPIITFSESPYQDEYITIQTNSK